VNDIRLFLGFFGGQVELMRAWRRDVEYSPLAPRQWPIGPHYAARFPGETGWVYHKLAAAEWYWSTLRQLDHILPELDRHVGVEMALDGCLASASSAVDAAVMRLIRSLARRRDHDGTTIPSTLMKRLFQADWKRVVEPLAQLPPAITLQSQSAARLELVDSTPALIAAEHLIDERRRLDAQPASTSRDHRLTQILGELAALSVGDVAELRWLRNRSTHEDTLVRRFYRGGDADTCHIQTPRGGFEAPVPYLRTKMDACRQLVDGILADAEAVSPT
jgi:hypothetical protein